MPVTTKRRAVRPARAAARDAGEAPSIDPLRAPVAPLGTLTRLPLSSIAVDYAWNQRTGADSLAVRDVGETEGLRGVAESIAFDGQDMPVFVRPNIDPKTRKKCPYALVAGFRRLAAVRLLVSERRRPHGVPSWDPKRPTILAVVRDLSEADARALNLRENVTRENLAPPDVGYALHMHKRACLAEGRAWSVETAAQKFGMTEARVRAFATIFDELESSLTDAWRAAPLQLSVAEMLALCRFPRIDQKAEYQKAVFARARSQKYNPAPGTSKKNGAGFSALDVSLKRAERAGLVLGEMMRLGFDPRKPDFGPYAAELVASHLKLTPTEIARLTSAMNAAFAKSYVVSVIIDGAGPY